MSNQGSNVCAICGGIKRIEYIFGFEECKPRDMCVEANNVLGGKWRLCPGHPEPETKHDGDLGEHTVGYRHGDIEIDKITNDLDHPVHVLLSPKGALSLLTWLAQEREELTRLAKEHAQ